MKRQESAKPAILGGRPVFEQLVPLVRPTLPEYDQELAGAVAELFGSGLLTKGRHLRDFEVRSSQLLGVKHAVAVSSCTLGLLLTYQALGLTGEVIVPSFTFMATVHPLIWAGVEPVFVDIDPETWNVDPVQVEEAISDRTTAIVAVHNFGNPAPITELVAIARRHQLTIVFDAAHGLGSSYQGRPVGGFGDVEVFSLSPTKLVVAGEGGLVTTNRDDIADAIRVGREYGNPGNYGSDFAGLNARMPEFNALLGLKSLELLEQNAPSRRRVAARFRSRLGQLPGLRFQRIDEGNECSYKDLSVVVDETAFGLNRDELAEALRAENVDTRKYHDPPVHTHRAYQHLAPRYHQRLPVTDWVARRSLSLPIWSHMDDSTADGICQGIERIHAHADQVREAVRSQRGPTVTTTQVAGS